MIKYAVINAQGEAIAQNLAPVEAARTILTYDSAAYEIRLGFSGWVLWGKPRNGIWKTRPCGSPHSMFIDAEAEILAEVVRSADTSNRWPAEAIPQADFDAMQEEIAP